MAMLAEGAPATPAVKGHGLADASPSDRERITRWAQQYEAVRLAAEFFGRRPRRFRLLPDAPAQALREGQKRVHLMRHGEGLVYVLGGLLRGISGIFLGSHRWGCAVEGRALAPPRGLVGATTKGGGGVRRLCGQQRSLLPAGGRADVRTWRARGRMGVRAFAGGRECAGGGARARVGRRAHGRALRRALGRARWPVRVIGRLRAGGGAQARALGALAGGRAPLRAGGAGAGEARAPARCGRTVETGRVHPARAPWSPSVQEVAEERGRGPVGGSPNVPPESASPSGRIWTNVGHARRWKPPALVFALFTPPPLGILKKRVAPSPPNMLPRCLYRGPGRGAEQREGTSDRGGAQQRQSRLGLRRESVPPAHFLSQRS